MCFPVLSAQMLWHILYTLSCAYIISQVPLHVSTSPWQLCSLYGGPCGVLCLEHLRSSSRGLSGLTQQEHTSMMGREGLAVGSVNRSTHTFEILTKIANFASRGEHLPALHSDVSVPAAPACPAAVPLFLCHSKSQKGYTAVMLLWEVLLWVKWRFLTLSFFSHFQLSRFSHLHFLSCGLFLSPAHFAIK